MTKIIIPTIIDFYQLSSLLEFLGKYERGVDYRVHEGLTHIEIMNEELATICKLKFRL